jgi:nitrogen fixation NifU-like protein
MSDLRDLYQEVILDHNRQPRNFGELEAPTTQADGHNPLCGDRLHLALRVEDDVVRDVRFTGSGCAISKASASLMTEAIKGRPLAEVRATFARFHEMITAPADADVERLDLGKLAVLGGVRAFPVRVKCASLAWHTLRAALDRGGQVVTTEKES